MGFDYSNVMDINDVMHVEVNTELELDVMTLDIRTNGFSLSLQMDTPVAIAFAESVGKAADMLDEYSGDTYV